MFPKSYFKRQYFHPRYFPPVVRRVDPPSYAGASVAGIRVDKKVYHLYTVLKAGIALTTFCNVLNTSTVGMSSKAILETETQSHDPNALKRKQAHQLLINLLILN